MAVCAMINGCSHPNNNENHEHSHQQSEGLAAEKGIVISDERQAILGIKTDVVKAGEFHEVIHTGGQIESSTGDEATVVAKSDGIITLSNLSEGSAVVKGARIATISSREIGSGDKLSKARITYETAQKEYERDLQLYEDNIVSESHLDKSRLEYEYAKAEYEALSSGGASSGGLVVSSPISGFVKELKVKNGDYVETGSQIASVSRNRRLRLRADLSEKYYGKMGQIRDANFTTSYSDKVFRLKELAGSLTSYGRTSDGDYFIPVIFEFDNRGELVPGSYVDVYLLTSESEQAIAVPLGAVVEDQGVHYVYVQDEDGDFLKREVSLGGSDGERVCVEKGLSEGEVIVVDGAIHVKLAGTVSAPVGHTHNH